MKTAFFLRCFSRVLWLMALAGAARLADAQPSNVAFGTFDYAICGWYAYSPTTLAWDSTQDDTGNGGGSCHTIFTLSTGALFEVNGSFNNCCFCDLEFALYLTNFASVDFDVKWDTNTSTVTPAQFNSNPPFGSPGVALGGMGQSNSFNIFPTICYSNVYIPDAATSGWAHVSMAINPNSTYLTNAFSGIYLAEEFASGSGTAAFWLDNVTLVTRKPPHLLPAISQRSGNDFTLQWMANPGVTCSVLKSTDLVNWATLVSNYPAGGLMATTCSYTDTNATSGQAFYRVRSP